MINAEQALKERIKELTCLYEVSSIIGDTSQDLIQDTLKAVALSLKKAFQFPIKTVVTFVLDKVVVSSDAQLNNELKIQSNIKVFNKVEGLLIAEITSSNTKELNFLKEEQQLLDNVALKVGNLLEHLEIKKRESCLKRQMEHADRLSILGEITAGIAHELNTPLANILGFAELLRTDLKSNKTALKDLDKIIQNTIFSREVVKKLMFFACKMPQEIQCVNIIPNIKNAIDLLDATFRKEQVKHLVKIKDDALWLRADPVQFTQIIFNLLMNAIYFSPKGGLVVVEALQTQKDIILKISDQGVGLSAEALDKVFQPFFTTKPIGEGSGLGLSVVHGIVASHKGTITAQNNPDKGAIFTITLPKP
ncbi:sensor histidine kinase [Gelatiniphilus marinus]|uniref:histidine kinase n=1 Tax=Gelatiniphilus marinus TaxID=1759464 RepID=A0ABW5JV14_9FLAO